MLHVVLVDFDLYHIQILLLLSPSLTSSKDIYEAYPKMALVQRRMELQALPFYVSLELLHLRFGKISPLDIAIIIDPEIEDATSDVSESTDIFTDPIQPLL